MGDKLRAALAPTTHPGSLIRLKDPRALDGWLAVVDEVTAEGIVGHANIPVKGIVSVEARHGDYEVVGWVNRDKEIATR